MGIIRPLIGESFEECRSSYLDYIEDCHLLIRTIKETARRLPGIDQVLAREIIFQQQELIKATYKSLKEMQRWWHSEKGKEGKNAGNRILAQASRS